MPKLLFLVLCSTPTFYNKFCDYLFSYYSLLKDLSCSQSYAL